MEEAESAKPHGVTSHRTVIFILTSQRVSGSPHTVKGSVAETADIRHLVSTVSMSGNSNIFWVLTPCDLVAYQTTRRHFSEDVLLFRAIVVRTVKTRFKFKDLKKLGNTYIA